MSFLLSEGHMHSPQYPLYRVWEEVRFARHRIESRLATEAVLTQSAVGSLLDKKAGASFKKIIKRLTDGQ